MSWTATGCKLQGRTSSILFREELDCVGCCQFQSEHTTLPRHYWGTFTCGGVSASRSGTAALSCLASRLFVELHQWELLMLSTNESYEVK